MVFFEGKYSGYVLKQTTSHGYFLASVTGMLTLLSIISLKVKHSSFESTVNIILINS